MKLNLVADYVVPGTGGKRFVAAFAIDASRNLIGLPGMVGMSFPVRGGGCIVVRPTSLTMCESKRKACAVENDWREAYKRDGRLWDYSSIDAYQAYKEAEGEARWHDEKGCFSLLDLSRVLLFALRISVNRGGSSRRARNGR